MTSDDDFLRELRATFAIEAGEHLQAIATGLLELEQSSPGDDARRRMVETVFRAAHSLKGAARAVDLINIESLCESLEDTFAAWKRQPDRPAPAAFDTVHRLVDAIASAIGEPSKAALPAETSSPPAPPTAAVPTATAPAAASAPTLPAPSASAGFAAEPAGAVEETVRIAVARLDAHVLEAEEMLAAKLAARQRAGDLRALGARFDAWNKEWTAAEPAARALRQTLDRPTAAGGIQGDRPGLSRLLGFLESNLDHVRSLERGIAGLTRTADHDLQSIGKLVDDLLENSKHLLSLPFATLTTPFPKLVRDLCRDQGKEADLVMLGEDVVIDKRVLEEMKAPLIHLLRNAVDHGIEPAEARRRAGKPPRATITIAAARVNGNKVQITVADDGVGIDLDRVKEKAVAHGLLSADAARTVSADEVRRLIFEPDVSTSRGLTRVSGRGLGLAIVREKAEKLGGSVAVESEPGKGAAFEMRLPSTIATSRGILVEAGGRLFVVPTVQVEHVVRINRDQIRTVEGRDTVLLDGRVVALASLPDVLELPPHAAPGDEHAAAVAIVLGTGDQRIAFTVDGVHDEREVLVKPLRKPLSRVRNIGGATVLASGQVAPILNVSDLLKSARQQAAAGRRVVVPKAPAAAAVKSVLVVEDSITSRMLIKTMLESAGYRVKTAVDGLEAFTLLRAGQYDLVVSDVEMPRLNGFDLTARIRADRKLADVPVVLVTALESREDRERGIDVGANAYIIKSRFDQSNLVDAVQRLI